MRFRVFERTMRDHDADPMTDPLGESELATGVGDRDRARAGRTPFWSRPVQLATVVSLIGAGLLFGSVNMRQPQAAASTPGEIANLTPEARVSSGWQLYVAPDGRPENPGSRQRPLALAKALSGDSPAQPGDTIWLRGGVYNGAFTSHLTGTERHPITVAQYPGERATLDGRTAPNSPTLTIHGGHAVYWGFEVSNSDPNRRSTSNGAPFGRATAIDVYGPYTKLIHLVVHDALNGIGLWLPALEAELYGNLIYNNGVQGPDRGHGHSIYAQNQTGTKYLRENILFNSFSFGVHAYTEGSYIDNLHLEGNVAFNHGSLSTNRDLKANFLVGGPRRVAESPFLEDNYGYYPWGSGGRNAEIGYIAGCRGLMLRKNYFAGGIPLLLTRCDGSDVTGNRFYGPMSTGVMTAFPANSYSAVRPSGLDVFVRPSRYERGRAHIIVYNWERRERVRVDLAAAGLRRGESFEVRDAQNYFGPRLGCGTYAGRPITLSLSGLTPERAVGTVPEPAVHTAPEFGIFVVVPGVRAADRRDALGQRAVDALGWSPALRSCG